MIVSNVVNQALRQDPTLAAGLLRLHFHDCFVQGCDGSVLIDSTKDNTAEKDSPANLSLRGFEIIDRAKMMIERAHTLGAARCSSFKHRLSKFDSTHDVDPTLDPFFAMMMSRTCSQGDNASMPLDWTTNSFDNAYFNTLQRGMGLLFSDQALTTDPKTQGLVNAFAMNQDMFFFNFQQAMVKMGLLDVKEGDKGEIRLYCHKVN
ncbi:Peroxidase [Cocos nucifera]|uniref:Peroxidase n=1 Tax=Cocos nucifera TaxID=13894 RepID=A0A8K0IQD2_COCNU|nr:Peroxidase [Cocos nucifera]